MTFHPPKIETRFSFGSSLTAYFPNDTLAPLLLLLLTERELLVPETDVFSTETSCAIKIRYDRVVFYVRRSVREFIVIRRFSAETVIAAIFISNNKLNRRASAFPIECESRRCTIAFPSYYIYIARRKSTRANSLSRKYIFIYI